jgi:monoamine oxidase
LYASRVERIRRATRRTKRRPVEVIVAGAGLAGLTAARYLERAGAVVTVIDARGRVGGRVLTIREGFADGQHAEAGGDLIEEEQTEVLTLAKELKLETVRILRSGWGFYGAAKGGQRKIRAAPDTFTRAAALLKPEIAAFKAADSQWDSGVARVLGRQSVADWIERADADVELASGLRGLRGFFLADPETLSLLALVDQFATGGAPGAGRMYRLRHGNDTLPAAMAKSLRGRLLLETVLKAVTHSERSVSITIDDGRQHELTTDFVVLALPASTLAHVVFRPALPAEQHRAIATLRYGAAARILLQFEHRFWRRFRRPIAYGTDQPIGAVWDANEQQPGKPGILTLLAGGAASQEVRAILSRGGWPALRRRLSWLGAPSNLIATMTHTWEKDRWSKGGYAVFDSRFDPGLRSWLARPAGRLAFAGEHTSRRWQGYMNGAIESGRRAAVEIAMLADLDYRSMGSEDRRE